VSTVEVRRVPKFFRIVPERRVYVNLLPEGEKPDEGIYRPERSLTRRFATPSPGGRGNHVKPRPVFRKATHAPLLM